MMSKEPLDWMVSPTICNSQLSSPPTIDEKVRVFHSRVRGWQLDIATQLLTIEHSGYAALAVVLSYFESIGKAQEGHAGRDRSAHFFKTGFRSFLDKEQAKPGTEQMMADFYSEVRCGLYHIGMTKQSVFLSGSTMEMITYDQTTRILTVNPHLLVRRMVDHCESYISELRDPSNTALRAKFDAYFSSTTT